MGKGKPVFSWQLTECKFPARNIVRPSEKIGWCRLAFSRWFMSEVKTFYHCRMHWTMSGFTFSGNSPDFFLTKTTSTHAFGVFYRQLDHFFYPKYVNVAISNSSTFHIYTCEISRSTSKSRVNLQTTKETCSLLFLYWPTNFGLYIKPIVSTDKNLDYWVRKGVKQSHEWLVPFGVPWNRLPVCLRFSRLSFSSDKV